MIGNSFLSTLYNYEDEDMSLNQLLELLKFNNKEFLDSLKKPLDISECNDEEKCYLTKVSALIDYYLQMKNFEVPDWIRDSKLEFKKPYYHSKHIDDFERLRLLYSSPAPFRVRNVYFDLEGIKRV